jgi:hypothetical protein
MSMNSSFRKDQGSYTFSLIGGEMSHLLIGKRSFLLLTSRHKSPRCLATCALAMFQFMITFTLGVKAKGGRGRSQNAGLVPNTHPRLWNAPTIWLYPTQERVGVFHPVVVHKAHGLGIRAHVRWS